MSIVKDVLKISRSEAFGNHESFACTSKHSSMDSMPAQTFVSIPHPSFDNAVVDSLSVNHFVEHNHNLYRDFQLAVHMYRTWIAAYWAQPKLKEMI